MEAKVESSVLNSKSVVVELLSTIANLPDTSAESFVLVPILVSPFNVVVLPTLSVLANTASFATLIVLYNATGSDKLPLAVPHSNSEPLDGYFRTCPLVPELLGNV